MQVLKRKRKPGRTNGRGKPGGGLGTGGFTETPEAGPEIDTDVLYDMGGWFGSYDGHNLVKELLAAEGELDAILPRTVLPNEKLLNNIVLAADRYERFNQERHMKLLRHKVAGLVSIFGRSRIEAIFAATGIISPEVLSILLGHKLDRHERKLIDKEIKEQNQAKQLEVQQAPR